jgi:hypothetical protein
MMTRGLPFEQLWMQKRRKTLGRGVAFMNKMVDEIIAERRKSAGGSDDKKDMLAAMMTGVDRATGDQLDDVNIRYQINNFLIAGHATRRQSDPINRQDDGRKIGIASRAGALGGALGNKGHHASGGPPRVGNFKGKLPFAELHAATLHRCVHATRLRHGL